MERGKHTEFELELKKSIARNLKGILIEKKMTQTKLSKITGIPTSTLSDYLNEKSLALPGNIQKISLALDVPKKRIDPSFGDSIDIPLESKIEKIPLIGSICAGNGLLAEQNIEELILYPFTGKQQPDYALKVKGDSMVNIGIENGDIVYLRKVPWAEFNGQVVAVLINDNEEGTLKRIRWSEGSPTISLIPENTSYETLEVYPSEIKVCGVYMGHFKNNF